VPGHKKDNTPIIHKREGGVDGNKHGEEFATWGDRCGVDSGKGRGGAFGVPRGRAVGENNREWVNEQIENGETGTHAGARMLSAEGKHRVRHVESLRSASENWQEKGTNKSDINLMR